MTAPERPGLLEVTEAEARTYITEIWCPPVDDGIQRLHSPMPEPEAEPELEAEAEL
jgi:hypothetical protein